MKKIERWIVYPLLIIVTIISLVSLCQEHPRNIGFDYIGMIVGVLSLLVTALISWQILTLIDIRKIRDNFNTRERDMSNKVENIYVDFYNSLAGVYNKLDDRFYYLFYMLNKCVHQSNVQQFEGCDDTITSITQIDGIIEVDKFKYSIIQKVKYSIKNTDKINNYRILEDYLDKALELVDDDKENHMLQNRTKKPKEFTIAVDENNCLRLKE